MNSHPTPEVEAVALKPCPFCGEPAVMEADHEGFDMVACSDGGCAGAIANGYLSLDAAVEAWNTRTPQAGEPSPAQGARHPMPDVHREDHDEALAWVLKHCLAVRRDNGDMDYSLGAVIAAYEAGKAAPAQPDAGELREVVARAIDPLLGANLSPPYAPKSPIGLAFARADRVLAALTGTQQAKGEVSQTDLDLIGGFVSYLEDGKAIKVGAPLELAAVLRRVLTAAFPENAALMSETKG